MHESYLFMKDLCVLLAILVKDRGICVALTVWSWTTQTVQYTTDHNDQPSLSTYTRDD